MSFFSKLFSQKKNLPISKSENDENAVILMYKDIPVAKISLDNIQSSSTISRLDKVYNMEHMPVGCIPPTNVPLYNPTEELSEQDRRTVLTYLCQWYESRCIPSQRPNLQEALQTLGIQSVNELSSKALGLSLTDQYWFKPISAPALSWKQVNLFENGFSRDVGDLLFDPTTQKLSYDYISPDPSTIGIDIKRWITGIDGEKYLIKANPKYEQVAVNESIASLIAKKLNVKAVHYDTVFASIRHNNEEKTCLFAVSKNFCDIEHSFIPVRVWKSQFSPSTTHVAVEHILADPELATDFRKMIALDFIMNNEDRHDENFGILMDHTTGHIEMAPVFDTGNSLFYDESISSQWVSDSSKLFSSSHHGNMFAIFRTASDINWFDYSEFLNIRNEMMELMENSNIEIIRRNRMCDVVEERVAELREHQIRLINKQMHHETLDDIIGSIDDNSAVNTDIIPNGLEDER